MNCVVGSTGTSVYKQSRNWVENCLFYHLFKPWSLSLKGPEGYPAKLT